MKIDVTGVIVDNDTATFYDWFDMNYTSPNKVTDALAEADGDDVEVNIASNGGDVFAASQIYTAFKSYSGKVTVNITGLAASAASVIAMAGDQINMAPTAQMMIHQVWTGAQGNADDMRSIADSLDEADKSIVNAYRLRTGLGADEIMDLLAKETWMSATTALDKGFIDSIMFVDEKKPQLVNAVTPIVPHSAVNKFMSLMAKAGEATPAKKEPETAPASAEGETQPQDAETKSALRDEKLAILFGKE